MVDEGRWDYANLGFATGVFTMVKIAIGFLHFTIWLSSSGCFLQVASTVAQRLREEADDEQACILVRSSRCPSGSDFGFSSLHVWIANESAKWIVLDLSFIYDRFLIRDELAIELYGLRNEPGLLSDTLAYGGTMDYPDSS
ncbi:hypothetical protein V8G54_037677 [Vigna mungo]|uniref:Uncharacterized protein n=1 Tax=Vigna mungo TaxID=3915 RepID=A0AAQ3REE1_VIGMU